ncbi:MAG: copper chaperone PCu(A)C [Brevundimonas sp.]|nr:MAG: copper chaperone PCu(A)C [Brevundimonas sp.]
MLRPIASGLALLALAACSSPERAPVASAGTVQATNAVCRPSAPGRRMALCYVTLTASQADSLVSATSPRAARVSLHDVPLQNSMIVLQPRSAPILLPAGEPTVLQPGGQALALQALDASAVVGETIPIVLTFSAAPSMQIAAPVLAEPAA